MILDRIIVEHVGKFTTRTEVGPFAPGLNILHAPNEAGKSTLLRAATRALFDRHTGKSDEIAALRPAGTELAPEITVEFRTATARHRVTKRFLHKPESRLDEWRADAWTPVAEADLADARLIEILAADAPGRGASKPEHWGLLRYLWARQGEPAAWPDWQGTAGTQIQRTLVRAELDPALDRLRAALAAEADAAFTEGGKIRANSPLHQLNAEIESATTRLAELRRQLAAIEENQTRHRDLAAQTALARRQAEEASAQAAAVTEELRRCDAAQRDLEAAASALQRAEEKLTDARRDAESLTDARQRAAALEMELAAARAAHAAHRSAEETAREKSEATARQATQLALAAEHAAEVATAARQRVRLQETRARLTQLEATLARVRELATALATARETRARLPQFTAKQIEKLRAAELAAREAAVRVEVSGLRIEIRPERAVEFRLDTGDGPESVSAASALTRTAAREAQIEIPDFGSIRVTSGASELAAHERALAEARKELAHLRETLGVPDADTAARQLAAAREAEVEIKSLAERLTESLGTHADESALAAVVTATRSGCERLATAEFSSDGAATATAVVAQADAAEAEELAARRAAQTAATARGDAVSALEAALKARVAAEATCSRVEAEHSHTLEKITALALRATPDALAAAQAEFVQAEARRDVAKRSLPPDFAQLPARATRLRKAADDALERAATLDREVHRLEGALGGDAGAGLHSQAAAIEERLVTLRVEAATAARRGQAARFLAILIERRKTGAVRRVLGPLEDQLSAVFAELSGDTTRRVKLDETLAIAGLSRGENELVPFADLSQGAREQLLLALRAAVALALPGPQCLVLDDALANTDALRQQRVLDFLTQISARVQVVVVTCFPERYAGVGSVLGMTRVG